jgi:predicted nucleic acid-binding protein
MIQLRKARSRPVAVIDTTLLSRLVELEIADRLPWLFRLILLPPEVKREAYRGPGRRRLRNLVKEMSGFFVDCYETNEFTRNLMKIDLDEGEAAAIAQAEQKQSVLLLDERKAFKRATAMQLTVIRTTRILIMLKEARAIAAVTPYFDKLAQTDFYLQDEVRRKLLFETGEL